MQQELKNKMQLLHDSLVGYSDKAYLTSKRDDLSFESRQYFEGKSEAYDYAALLLDQTLATAGIFIQSADTMRFRIADIERRDGCSDAPDLDVSESFYSEEHETN